MPFEVDAVIVTFGTGRSAVSTRSGRRQTLSNQYHEQDIRHIVVEQEAKADIAGRYRSGGYGSPREARATLIFTGAYTRRIPAQPLSKSR